MCSWPRRAIPALFAVVWMVCGAEPARAVTSCKLKTVPRTGAVLVTASGVGANPRWGTFPGFDPATEGAPLFDEATCCSGGTCKSCHLGAAGTLAERTPPASCQICLRELAMGTECCTILKHCTPGVRLRDASFAAADPRFESVEVVARPTLRFVGVNVQIVDGSGSTAPGAADGTGNLIIGYNEDTGTPNVRSGTHTLVIGTDHSWSGYAGLLAGTENTVNGPYASVSGGCGNVANYHCSAVSGGLNNLVDAQGGSVSGGQSNVVAGVGVGVAGSISGGLFNQVVGGQATISGGVNNTAVGFASSIAGGSMNTVNLGGTYSTIAGGATNTMDGAFATIGGGTNNVVSGAFASVSAGNNNTASEPWGWVGGGTTNDAGGNFSAVCGGDNNRATGLAAAVTAGSGNVASGQWSGVSGGQGNTASSAGASVSGGASNVAGPTFQNASVSGGNAVQAGGPGGAPEEWHAGAASGFPTFGPPFGPGTY